MVAAGCQFRHVLLATEGSVDMSGVTCEVCLRVVFNALNTVGFVVAKSVVSAGVTSV